MVRYDSPSTLAVIPARAGSKGVPGKNLAFVAGKPLIAHTIAVALASKGIDRVVVSTDCPRIAETARAYGGECPFLRPVELATDDAPGRSTWKHALAWLSEHEDYRPKRTVLLQPTSPLRSYADVEGALEFHERTNADWVVSVTRASAPSPWLAELDPEGRIRGYASIAIGSTQRPAPSPMYLPNGAVFVAKSDVLMYSESLYTDRTFAYTMPVERSLDIDTPWQIYLADLVLRDRSHGRLA